MSNGDRPLHFFESSFLMAEAARLAKIEEKTIRNWIARDVLDVGSKEGPRWTFSASEILVLKVASHLVTCARMEANIAARIASVIAPQVEARINEMSQRNPCTGRLIELENGYQHWQAVLVAIDGNNIRTALAGSDPSRRDPPRYTDADFKFLRLPHVVIPIDALVIDLLLDVERLWDGLPLEGEE